jgi:hypothetical protein
MHDQCGALSSERRKYDEAAPFSSNSGPSVDFHGTHNVKNTFGQLAYLDLSTTEKCLDNLRGLKADPVGW